MEVSRPASEFSKIEKKQKKVKQNKQPAVEVVEDKDKTMAEVVVYVTQSCPYCMMARRLFDSKGVNYQIVDVGRDAQMWADMEAKTGRNTVPQVFIGNHHIGGFDDLSAADKRGEIDPLLNA